MQYASQEHIFPAGIGGIQKLPKGYVSDEFNTDISKLEQSFLRESFISAARQTEGPGKRGSLSEKKATKSVIHVLVESQSQQITGLGYIKLGKAFEIPNVKINVMTGQLTIGFDQYSFISSEENIKQFISRCEDPQILNIRTIVDDRLEPETILFGIEENIEENFDGFFARHSSNKMDFSTDYIQRIGKSLHAETSEPQAQKYWPLVHQSVKFKEDYFRIYGKIAFNFLASLKGKEFALNTQFDPLRNWITGDGVNEFAKLDTSPAAFQAMLAPKDQSIHYVILSKVNDMLIASVSFYGALKSIILLAKNFHEPFQNDGLICEWKNQREYKYMEYVAKIVMSNTCN
ncbi:MAG: hypothetical protein IPP81_09125 [Chitinophagaceae bacterium]|nr:hypothetical protein [Chitinophagaceae bacterium]